MQANHDIAHYLAEQGRLAEAEALFREVLTARCRALPHEHPRTLETRYEIAMALAGQGNAADAQIILDQIQQVQRKVLGPGHPDTLRTEAAIDGLPSPQAQ